MKVCNLTRHSQRGLTLLELLIAMTLGVFLLTGVVQTFTSARQTYRMEDGLSRLIENGRYAIEFIDRDVRMAGFGGCKGPLAFLDDDTASDLNHLATTYNTKFGTPLQGFHSTSASAWTPTIDPSLSPDGGSDVITIRRADETGYTVTSHATPASNVTLNSTTGLNPLDNVLIADCNHAEVFAITNIGVSSIAHGNVLINSYPTGEVFPIHTISYYIKAFNGIPTLYRKMANDPQPLIEGVEGLQIEYGEDTDLDPMTGISTDPVTLQPDYTANYYVPADTVVDMRRVVSVRIQLLVRTIDDNVTAAAQTYTFAGANHTATDKRIRHVFTSTIALRNRIK
jgi:type IV pilus assembly protein PilW